MEKINEEKIKRFQEFINEACVLKDDEMDKMNYPVIPEDHSQLLLNYMASEVIHQKRLQENIIKFLLAQRPTEISSYLHASIYFRLAEDVKITRLNQLNNDFKVIVTKLEKQYNGKVFWLFQKLETFKADDKTKRVRLIGEYDSSFDDRFQKTIDRIKAQNQ